MDHFTGTGLTCVRGDRIIFTGLTFTLNPGEALVLSGPNGSGKTSLLRVMAGLSPPTAGIIKWRGQAVPDDPHIHVARLHLGRFLRRHLLSPTDRRLVRLGNCRCTLSVNPQGQPQRVRSTKAHSRQTG